MSAAAPNGPSENLRGDVEHGFHLCSYTTLMICDSCNREERGARGGWRGREKPLVSEKK